MAVLSTLSSGKEVPTLTENLISILNSIVAGVLTDLICYYIRKWLDGMS